MESKERTSLVQTVNPCEGSENNVNGKESSSMKVAPEDDNKNCVMEHECVLSLCYDNASENLQPNEDSTTSLPFTYLPEVVLVNIMEYLSLKERYCLSLTCKLFYDLFSHPQLWKVAHISLFTQDNQRGSSQSWRLKSVMHQTMVEIVRKFAHLFQHLSLDMFRFVQLFDDNCRRMLENLNKDCRLESLSIRLGALTPNDEFVQRASAHSNNFSEVPLVVGLIQNAVRLKRLSIISWPLSLEGGDNSNIFEVLLRNEKIKGLQSLSLFYVDVKSESWTERNPKLLSVETTLKLVSHFRNLTHLALRSPMVNNEVILELASKKRSKLSLLQILIVYLRDSVFQEGYKVPDISAAAWKALKMSSPGLKVEYLVITRIPQEQLNIMLKPEVPLSALTILNYGRCDSELIKSLIEMYKSTLQKFVCLCAATDYDLALTDLVSCCDSLENLTYHGCISYKTVILLAEIFKKKDIKLKCFEFKEKSITTTDSVSDDRDEDIVIAKDTGVDEYYLVGLRSWHQDEEEHERKLRMMSEHVSNHLGHRWQPLA